MKLFHVSSKYLGEEVLFEPRVPIEGKIGWEPKTPRICVCAEIQQCLIAITKSHLDNVMYVYQAVQPKDIEYNEPWNHIEDWEDTEEIWILTPTKFKFVCSITVERNLYTDGHPTFKKIRNSKRKPPPFNAA